MLRCFLGALALVSACAGSKPQATSAGSARRAQPRAPTQSIAHKAPTRSASLPSTSLPSARPAPAQLLGLELPPPAAQVLREILADAGLSSARVSSVRRTPREQVEQMYAAIVAREARRRGSGFAYTYHLYGPAGAAVTRVLQRNQRRPKAVVLRLMEQEIVRQLKRLGTQRTELMHVSDTHYVFDVAPSSIVEHAAFVKAVQRHRRVSRFLRPPQDEAFHLEVPK